MLQTTLIVCDGHRDSSLPFAEFIFGQPGVMMDLQRQLDKMNCPTKLTTDMIPVFEMTVIPVKVKA